MRLLVSDHLVERYGGRMRALAPGIEFVEMRGDGSFSADPQSANMAVLSSDLWEKGTFIHMMRVLPELPELRWFHVFAVGLDHPVFTDLVKRGVTVTNTSGFNSKPIAQYVLAMMLHHAKRIGDFEAQQRARIWKRVSSDELTGKTLALIGLGGIGSEVARLVAPFEMRVIGVRRSSTPVANVDEVLPPSRLHDVLHQADYVVVACPLTAQTRGMIDEAAFAAMKPEAHFINVGRGPIVVEDALIAALRESRIAGAALDVFEHEPLSAESPLWEMPNVIITPHNSGASPLSLGRGATIFLDNLRRYAAGEPLPAAVTGAEDAAG
jgi:phosphoglycerate dehydrogenase-like enzyme